MNLRTRQSRPLPFRKSLVQIFRTGVQDSHVEYRPPCRVGNVKSAVYNSIMQNESAYDLK